VRYVHRVVALGLGRLAVDELSVEELLPSLQVLREGELAVGANLLALFTTWILVQ
jgi:hypothetical protein